MAKNTTRLDLMLVEMGHFESRERARRAVMAGLVEVGGQRVDKPGTSIRQGSSIRVSGPAEPFVSRAGRKLEAALVHFEILVHELVCLDIGASTGGFTDCLLERGATRVYAVDVGYGQLDHRLRKDSRVVVRERVNARYLKPDDLPEPCQLVTIDVSFISLLKVVPALMTHLAPGGHLICLVKPQFEAGRRSVGRGGIVRDEAVRQRTIEATVEGLVDLGLHKVGVLDSPVVGAKGNREALACFVTQGTS